MVAVLCCVTRGKGIGAKVAKCVMKGVESRSRLAKGKLEVSHKHLSESMWRLALSVTVPRLLMTRISDINMMRQFFRKNKLLSQRRHIQFR
jgi:hypothetical protein